MQASTVTVLLHRRALQAPCAVQYLVLDQTVADMLFLLIKARWPCL